MCVGGGGGGGKRGNEMGSEGGGGGGLTAPSIKQPTYYNDKADGN